MSAINDLIEQIPNPELRFKIRQEVDRMSKQKKFGLVFEEHLPECTPLYDHQVKKGSIVARKSGKVSDNFVVKSIADGKAECEGVENHEIETIDVAELVCVARFGEPIYPYLKPIDSICNAPDSDLWHTLIEADNYHALQLLEYLYAGKVDCIYIDPPYNTGARDWKYNNDYVDSADSYRHSKWLSMMQKRLAIAKRLLNPKDSVLIVTIDEKEYLHLGCLLEEMFPEALTQMVTIVINPFGQERNQQMARVEEYAFFIFMGNAAACSWKDDLLNERTRAHENLGEATSEVATPTEKIRWEWLLRGGADALRKNNPNLFFPVFVDIEKHAIQSVGLPLKPDEDRNTINAPEGCVAVWPIKTNGVEGRWRCSHEYLRELIEQGCARVGEYDKANDRYSLLYLSKATMKRIEDGEIEVLGRDDQNSLLLGKAPEREQLFSVKTVWNRNLHRSGEFGTRYIRTLLPGRSFSYPKSLYAVRDTLKVVVNDKPNALILDFFAGSGTTLHAVNLLNAEDGGKRRCIMVTNNEVSEDEAKALKKQGFKPGDDEWEQFGIARYINWPRAVCSITGKDINGVPLKGQYMESGKNLSDGFATNASFFKLGFLDKNSVALGRQFKELVPLLWMKAGAFGPCPILEEGIPDMLILPQNRIAILIEEQKWLLFEKKLYEHPEIETVFIITDSESGYREMIAQLNVKNTYQLYRDYLDNFRINKGR